MIFFVNGSNFQSIFKSERQKRREKKIFWFLLLCSLDFLFRLRPVAVVVELVEADATDDGDGDQPAGLEQGRGHCVFEHGVAKLDADEDLDGEHGDDEPEVV